MARVKIIDLPKDMKVSFEELRMIRGGYCTPEPEVLGKSGGTAQDEIDAFVDANPSLITVNDGSISPPDPTNPDNQEPIPPGPEGSLERMSRSFEKGGLGPLI